MPARHSLIATAKTLVIKIGSRVLSDQQGQLDVARIQSLAGQLSQLRKNGKHVVLVSSGAVAAGMGKLGISRRPSILSQLQAVASVGQAHLIQSYERFLSLHGIHAAQVLLIADDLDNRQRYLNVRNTLHSLLEMGVIPIVNENDSVSVDELLTTFGDNDRLAAMVAGLFNEAALIILSDVEGVYNKNPKEPCAEIIPLIEKLDDSVLQVAAQHDSQLSKGGMSSKLAAAQFVTQSGTPVAIAGGRVPDVLLKLVAGEQLGTLFIPHHRALAPKKRWIGFTAQVTGAVDVDAGAAAAMREGGTSLLAIGITKLTGNFEKGDIVSLRDPAGSEIARGLINYNSVELLKIIGVRSPDISAVLGHCPYEEVIHSENMTLMQLPN